MKHLLLLLPLLIFNSSIALVQENPEPSSNKINQSQNILRLAQSLFQQEEEVYVLLYKTGTSQEGIHSIDYHDGRVVVMIFENKKDALLFANKLKAQNFAAPTVSEIYKEDIEAFAIQAGYKLRLVKPGQQVNPPKSNAPTPNY